MKKYAFLLLIIFINFSYSQVKERIDKLIIEKYPTLDTIYKNLHKYPELSGQEKETSKKVAQILKQAGYNVTENIGGYGVIGIYKNGAGPALMIRSDMDALPVEEKTGLPYSSCTKGINNTGAEVSIMHACGHDMHTTIMLGTAELLMQMKNQWKGTLVFVSQPAEEGGTGAKKMLNDGLFTKYLKPDFALALHVNPTGETGTISVDKGPMFASVDEIDITVFGNGGHGAMPDLTIDPIVLSARLILDIQTLISREKAPLKPAVLTVGSIHGGTRPNIIPNEVKLQLTLRTYDETLKDNIIAGIRRICNGLAYSAGLPENKYPKITLGDDPLPPAINDDALTEKLINLLKNKLGKDKVLTSIPSMAGEDFGRYGKTGDKIPIFIFWLGVTSQERMKEGKPAPLHSPYFYPDMESMKTGITVFTLSALELLKK